MLARHSLGCLAPTAAPPMQAPRNVLPQRHILLLGPAGDGKSTLIVRYVQSVFITEYDPTIEDEYRKVVTIDGVAQVLLILCGYSRCSLAANSSASDREMTGYHDEFGRYAVEENLLRLTEAIIYLKSVDNSRNWEEAKRELVRIVQRVRQFRGLADDAPLPAFFVATKCDQPRSISREELVNLAVHHRFQGYYETSSKTPTNVDELFADAARLAAAQATPKAVGAARKELEKLSGVTGLLPWNWSKRAKWNATLKRLEFTASAKLEAQVMRVTEQNVDEFRFPEPELKRAPVSFYTDLRQLIELKDGIALSDVSLVGSDGTEEIKAHNDVLRELVGQSDGNTVKVEGVSSATLKHVVHFIYTDQLPPAVRDQQTLVREIMAAGHMLHLPDLVAESARHAKARAIADSAAVERQMRPALTEKSITKLSDVKFVVGERSFRLHRALLWARSAWFRALLDEKWRGGGQRTKIEVSSMTAAVFAVVVEYLYTGRASIGPEEALDVLVAADMLSLPRLVQLAEFALQPVIDAGNAVPLYLAAVAHGARQLAALCEYWMATDLAQTTSNEQWGELSAEVRARVATEHRRLQETRAAKREEMKLLAKLPCLLVPIVAPKAASNPKP